MEVGTAGMMDVQADSGRSGTDSGGDDSEGSDGRGSGGCGARSSPGSARELGAEEAEATNTSDDWCRVSESRCAAAAARSHARLHLRAPGACIAFGSAPCSPASKTRCARQRLLSISAPCHLLSCAESPV